MIADTEEPEGQFEGGALSHEDIQGLLEAEKRASAALKTQLAQERTQRTQAESQVANAQMGRFEAEEQAVKSRLEATDEAAKGLKASYAAALAEGRFDDATELNDKLAELRARQQNDKNYEAWLLSEKTRLQNQPPPPAGPQGIDLRLFTPGQRQWIERHPEFHNDEPLRKRTQAGHAVALARNVPVDSEAYFEIIDHYAFEDGDLPPPRRQEPEPPPRRREPARDMPVTRRTPERDRDRDPRQVRLTADEMEAADMTMPDTPVQGRKDPNTGQWLPGRYEKYVINRQNLARRG
jgi:hypothetical protein